MQPIESPSILISHPLNIASMSIKVIRASLEHAEVIANFNQSMALETENKILEREVILPGVKKMLEDDSLGFYLVAQHQGSIAGCLGVTYEWSDWRNGLFWWIQSVFVAPQHRTRGVFSSMYASVKDQALADERSCGIRLYVERDNDTAYRTYTGLGMLETDYRLMEEPL